MNTRTGTLRGNIADDAGVIQDLSSTQSRRLAANGEDAAAVALGVGADGGVWCVTLRWVSAYMLLGNGYSR